MIQKVIQQAICTSAFFKIWKAIQATIYDPKRDTAGYLH